MARIVVRGGMSGGGQLQVEAADIQGDSGDVGTRGELAERWRRSVEIEVDNRLYGGEEATGIRAKQFEDEW